MSNLAVDSLRVKRQQLVDVKNRLMEEYDTMIVEFEMAIETLTGDKFLDIPPTERFDDENPDYIKASLEEI